VDDTARVHERGSIRWLGRWRSLIRGTSAVRARSAPEPARCNGTPLFVGGCWRSGTTILHALICTSPDVNDYIGECSYFSALVHSLAVGLEAFGIHTRYYFASREELVAHHASILRAELDRVWRRVGTPAVLALKDPLLTPSFPLLASTLPEARFVVSVRDPSDTLSSRIEVFRRMNGGAEPEAAQVRDLCGQYVATYRAVTDNFDAFAGRLCLIDYRSLVTGKHARLREFGLTRIEPGSVWRSGITDVREHAGNPWLTPLYGRTLSAASLGRHRGRLSGELQGLILDICGDVWRDLSRLAGQETGTYVTALRENAA